MRIDDNILHQARTADVLAFLEKYHGFTFAHQGGAYRCEQHKSLAVKADRLSWYWHSRGVGGYGALDYLVKVENMPFRETVEVITGTTPTQHRVKLGWSKVPTRADINSHRADYCKTIYQLHARPISEIPKADRYYCRGDRKGIVYDKRAMRIASNTLGHNRISVIAGHYLYDKAE